MELEGADYLGVLADNMINLLSCSVCSVLTWSLQHVPILLQPCCLRCTCCAFDRHLSAPAALQVIALLALDQEEALAGGAKLPFRLQVAPPSLRWFAYPSITAAYAVARNSHST